jgi:hypothetical protein
MRPGPKSIMKFGTTKLSKGEVMKNIGIFAFCALVCASSYAALPPLSEEAQAAANLAKAKTAYGDKVAAYQLCQAQNRVADQYRAAGTSAPAACVAPPPFEAPVVQAAEAPKAK